MFVVLVPFATLLHTKCSEEIAHTRLRSEEIVQIAHTRIFTIPFKISSIIIITILKMSWCLFVGPPCQNHTTNSAEILYKCSLCPGECHRPSAL